MKLDEILQLWSEDSVIDRTELGSASLDIPKLHNKYYKIYVQERMLYHKIKSEFDVLRLEKIDFYSGNSTKEQFDKGWELPAKGRILKQDLPDYLNADPDLIKITLKLAYQKEKIDMLESIIKTVASRSFHINAAIEWAKFQTGQH